MQIVWQTGPERVEVEDRPVPHPGEGEVLIRVVASALCGSELKGYRSDHHGRNGGHEAVGEVVELGPGCSHLRVGDRVGVSAVQGCGRCAYCAAGQYTYCEQHVVFAGMHAEYALTRELGCQQLPDDVPWGVGVLLTGDGLGVPFHVGQRLGERTGADRLVVIFGVGPVGLGNVLVEHHLGAEVVAVDLSRTRLAMAQKLGAARTVLVEANAGGPDPASTLAQRVREVCGRAPDVCLECAGRQETLFAALSAVRTAGTVVCVGEQGPAPISPSVHLIHRDITLMGSWFYHFSEYPAMLALYRAGLPVADLISDRFQLTEAQQAYRLFAAGETGKVLLCPDSRAHTPNG